MGFVLREFIEAEGLVPGDRLPSERDLALKLALPRTALRRMLAELEAEGRLTRHVGSGTFVSAHGYAQRERSNTVKINEKVRTYPAEVFEARLVVEPRIAALAAMRAMSPEIDEMSRIIQKARSVSNFAEFEKWDAAFHGVIARAARNNLLATLYDTIHAVRSGKLWGKMKEQSLTPERMAAYCDKHQLILEAIIDRDGAEAEKHMTQHIVEARENILGSGSVKSALAI